jgi:hypothetical protein
MTLIQELNKTKNRIGLVSGSLKVNEYDDMDENVSAHINPRNWNIEINLKRGFEPVTIKRQKAYARLKKISDPKRQMLEDILHHELAHWELPFNSGYGCPFDTYNHDKILESVKNALPEDKQNHASYVANAFEDLVINKRCRDYTGNFAGQVMFFDEQGMKMEGKGLTSFYEAFVKLNLDLWGDNADRALMKRHYQNSEEVKRGVENVQRKLGLDREDVVEELFDKNQWARMAFDFTEGLAHLLDEPPIESLSAYQKEGDGSEKEKEQEGNGIEQKLKTKQGKEEVAFGRYANKEGQSMNIESFEQLDLLYKKLAKSIPVNVEAFRREASMEIAPLNFRPFDFEKDDIRKAKTSKLYLTEDGLTFGYRRQPLTIDYKSKIQRKSFPDFKMIMLDNSGSMGEAPDGSRNIGDTNFIPWGDNSKYHYALLGKYGIEQFLQNQGIAQYIGHGLSMFSSSTRYEESNFQDLHKLRKLALSPEFGGTRIDAGTLTKALSGKQSFVLSISDGEIGNWSSVKDDILDLARENYYAHIQIGDGNRFTRDLEDNEIPVCYARNGEELSRLMVDVATDTYRRFTHGIS